ncbi:hypothetical protein HDU92_005572 [Lobulomyces angularis]|nr:hypothetical protein HDU92_005572 [Lobulomyces angularis]
MSVKPKILIVGAGAVGAVYGYHLMKGGAEVTFMVREKYAKNLKNFPILLYQYSMVEKFFNSKNKSLVTFAEYNVRNLEEILSSQENLKYEYILLTISSAALRSNDGGWIKDLVQKTEAKNLITFTPGKEDVELLMNVCGGVENLNFASGFITIISYSAPLEKESFSPFEVKKTDISQDCFAYLAPSSENIQYYGKKTDVGYTSIEKFSSLFNKGGLKSSATHVELYKNKKIEPPAPILIAQSVITPLLMG